LLLKVIWTAHGEKDGLTVIIIRRGQDAAAKADRIGARSVRLDDVVGDHWLRISETSDTTAFIPRHIEKNLVPGD